MQDRLEFALELAQAAGKILRAGFNNEKAVRYKGAIDLVTEYDERSEQLIIDAIQARYPHDSILAEESGMLESGEARWLIDPLDGTTNYAHGLPIFCVSIAYAQNGQTELGVIYDPMRQELFQTLRGAGTWLNGKALRVSETSEIDKSLLVTGFAYNIQQAMDNNLGHFADFVLRARGVRRLGSAALDLAYVAAGRMDAYWELDLHPWDWAAGALMVEEAGGKVTRADGGAHIFEDPPSLLASNGVLHATLLQILNQTEST